MVVFRDLYYSYVHSGKIIYRAGGPGGPQNGRGAQSKATGWLHGEYFRVHTEALT